MIICILTQWKFASTSTIYYAFCWQELQNSRGDFGQLSWCGWKWRFASYCQWNRVPDLVGTQWYRCKSFQKCHINVLSVELVIGGTLGSTLWLLLAFCPTVFGGGRNQWMVLCHFMNAASVLGIPWGGGDTQTLPYAKKKSLNFLHSQMTGRKNFACTEATIVELSQH